MNTTAATDSGSSKSQALTLFQQLWPVSIERIPLSSERSTRLNFYGPEGILIGYLVIPSLMLQGSISSSSTELVRLEFMRISLQNAVSNFEKLKESGMLTSESL